MRILFVTSEAHPLVKTGGLADVSGALPAALRAQGDDVRILIPGYRQVFEKLRALRVLMDLHWLPEVGSVTLMAGEMPDTGTPVMTIACPQLYEREGGPYQDSHGRDWPDNPLRFGILSRVAAILSSSLSPLSAWVPDIVHFNDWQSGLTPAFMHYSGTRCARTVLGIHNLAFQGNFSPDWLQRLGLPWHAYQMHGLEYYGQLSFLKAGIYYADRITTVSPTYAREIQTEAYGFGMQGLLRARRNDIFGILNGIDIQAWNPSVDPHLAATYDRNALDKKSINKHALQARLGLVQEADAPLLGVVSRMTHQKGLDMLLGCAPKLLTRGCQLAVLGSGDPQFERGFRALAEQHHDQVSVTIGYDEALSHQIMAGADMFIMPSRFEPCGLNQMYGLAYGTPPVVRRTGGLADSVQDTTPESLANGTATGFVFDSPEPEALLACIDRALEAYHDASTWRAVQFHGMARDLSWNRSAESYRAIYRALL